MQTRRKTPILSATAVVALAGATYASTIPHMDLTDLYQEAAIIVHGRVIDQSSQWEDIDGNNLIFTYSTLRVESSAKAPARSRLMVVRSVGGQVNDFNQTLIGEASLRPGEEVVLFITQEEGWSRPSVVGFHNGKFGVQRDASGAVSLVRDQGQVPGAAPTPADRFSLDRFLDTLDAVEAGELDEHGHVHDALEPHPLVRARQIGERMIDSGPLARDVVTPSQFTLTFAAPSCPDTNGDGSVDTLDLSAMVSAWGGSSPTADLDESGTVDVHDLAALTSGWGSCR